MLWLEIKKNTITYAFVLAVGLMVTFILQLLTPNTDYYYGKPLSYGEYTYFNLKEDIKYGSMLVYGGEEENGIPVDLELNDEIRDRIRNIIIKINPDYKANEKISDVNIALNDEEIIKLVREFEKTIGYRTNYRYGDKSGPYVAYKNRRFGINRTHEDGRNTIEEERADFESSLNAGLSEGYARYLMNYLGILAVLLSAIISAAVFIKDRKSRISEFLYTSNIKSKEIVITRLVSVILPMLVVTLGITKIGMLPFYDSAREYGHSLSDITFLKYWLIWIVPSIIITVSLSVLLDILFNNIFVVVIVQFILWLLSVSVFIGNYEPWRIVIRFNSFGMSKYYDSIKNAIYVNRLFMVILSILISTASVYLYDGVRKGKRIRINAFNNLWKRLILGISLRKQQSIKFRSRSFLSYQLDFACNINVLMSILFLTLILVGTRVGRSMTESDIKTAGESIVIYFSMFMLIPLCNIEKKNSMSEFTCVSNTAYTKIFFTRLLSGVIMTVVLITFSLYFMSTLNNVALGLWVLSICVSSLYLGLLGVIFSEVTGTDKAGYISYLGYYFFCVKEKENFKLFNVCCYTNRLKYSVISLIAGIVIMSVILFFIIKRKGLGRKLWNCR